MVNPAITNNAVAGMPLSQAGVASAIASTSRQVGAAIGIAVAGTVVAAGRARGSDFTQITHPVWWSMTDCGAVVLLLGWVSSTPRAHASTSRIAHLTSDMTLGRRKTTETPICPTTQSGARARAQ
jgi:hypothetical protein